MTDILSAPDFFGRPLPDVQTATKVTVIPAPAGVELRSLKFAITAKSWNGPVKVRAIQHQTIGIFSPQIKVSAGSTSVITSIWDPYCHYSRNSFVTLFSVVLASDTEISVAVIGDDPPYETCRRDGVKWPKPDARLLKPKGNMLIICDGDLEVLQI